MTPITSFAGKHVALFGLGGSGLVTARALLAGGALVAAWDDNAAARDRAEQAGVAVTDLATEDWSRFIALVLAPGVPLTHPTPHWTVEKAQAAEVEVIGDIELFCRERAELAPSAPFVAITGTNGKSTTTALIAHLLRTAGHEVCLGGNIGVPILELDPPSTSRVHVIECSSFQIDLAPSLAPSVGVVLNVTPDHLDRHGTMEAYAAIKERLVAATDFAVIGDDDDWCREMHRRREGPSVAISGASATDGIYVAQGSRLVERRSGSVVTKLADLTGIRSLRGAHNGQNAAAAVAAISAFDIAPAVLQQGLATFPGLPHRMEEVGRLGPVLFINDSKATNADAAEKALLSFDDMFWIIGGKSKEGGIEPLRPLFPKIRKAYLIGASTEDFARTLGSDVLFERCGTLDVALERAASDAAASGADEPVVLLSPACASYDQFPNFEVRGDHFRNLVRALMARQPNP
jgi:UDP-N-acetylmuramoylalanine--D-glutamate ligase